MGTFCSARPAGGMEFKNTYEMTTWDREEGNVPIYYIISFIGFPAIRENMTPFSTH